MPHKVIPAHHSETAKGQDVSVLDSSTLTRQEDFGAAWASAHLEDMGRIEQSSRSHNLFKRLRSHRALTRWLNEHGPNPHESFRNQAHAIDHYTTDQKAHNSREAEYRHTLEQNIGFFREHLKGFDDTARSRADDRLREYHAPAELIVASDQEALARGQQPDLITWLGHAPTEDEPYGATNQQLEEMLLWNAQNVQRIAELSTETLNGYVASYEQKVKAAVDRHALHPSWTNQGAVISNIVIGDFFDPRSHGRNGATRRAFYHLRSKELVVWPHALKSEATIEEVIEHESNHSKGGFSTTWLGEAYTERFAAIIGNRDPNDSNNNTYYDERKIINTLHSGAVTPFGDYEASGIYIGEDHRMNEYRLVTAMRDAYNGIDVIGAISGIMSRMSSGLPLNRFTKEQRMHILQTMDFAATTLKDIGIAMRDANVQPDTLVDYFDQLGAKATADTERIAYAAVYTALKNRNPAPANPALVTVS